MWQDNQVKFDVSHSNMQLRPGELTVDKLDMIEDTKGNAGDLGRLIVTNLRIIWHSLSLPRINLSIGYNTFITVNTKILHTVHDVYIQALHILTSFRNSRYEFIFTNHDTKSTRHYTSVIGVYRAYVSSKIYREIKLRSGIIRENRLVLLPQEKVHSSVKDVWNLSIEQGNIGTFIITNIRLVWYADVNYQFNVSIPYLTIGNITIRTSKFGPTLVILSTEASGGYILGFRVNPLQQLHITYKEISILRSEFEKFPIFGVEYTFEHQAPVQEEISIEHFTEIQDNQAEISNIFGYYFSERETSQRKPNYSIHLGLATEEPREGSTLQNLWELVPSSVN
ncbi:PREDICTED: Bardet-Biedl syndrome 5 protein homolog [Acromyrmex echinatior]|uniref:Bardet-Biedl syndrome 5 protein-like protein n=1 Tax=Acromyrmex echinatior TaxID=103372 RepID=F4WAX0_ACREC|nr:PREDICTED: Bardet-Biedl syndrome 5 protein homolog [Acromyrmex echinatior]EGI68660.1 Bardet-Biedl syndrome 5 protein-like protein [Acromyrmex echinatior]